MIINKTITVPLEIEIEKADLLTVEEVEKLSMKLKYYDEWWWTQSPGVCSYYGSCVINFGSIIHRGMTVDLGNIICVRPALRFSKMENMSIGDKFLFRDKEFQIIDNGLAFCLSDIGSYCFRNNIEADNANVYEYSDIKDFIDSWFRGIKTKKRENISLLEFLE